MVKWEDCLLILPVTAIYHIKLLNSSQHYESQPNNTNPKHQQSNLPADMVLPWEFISPEAVFSGSVYFPRCTSPETDIETIAIFPQGLDISENHHSSLQDIIDNLHCQFGTLKSA